MGKHIITEEEKNKILLSSPMSLPNNPSEKGMKAETIKAFFYRFISVFIEKLNGHLSELESAIVSEVSTHNNEISAHQYIIGLISDLVDKDTELGNSLSIHNTSSEAHQDIREQISNEINTHNGNEGVHPWLQGLINNAFEKATEAYNLAKGKSRVYPFENTQGLVEAWHANEYNVGDVFITIEANVPDFTLVSKDAECGEADTAFSYANYTEISFEAGKVYYFEDKKLRLGATDGGYDHSKLTLKTEFEALVEAVNGKAEQVFCDEIKREVSTKEEKKTVLLETAEEVVLNDNTELNLDLRTSIILCLPENIPADFEAYFNFRSGTTPTSLDAPDNLIFTGDDTLDGKLYPVSNRIYEVSIKSVGGYLIARVGCADYEVIQ